MEELIHKLGIDWKLLLANAVTFLIVLWVLRKYAFGPILKILDQRREMAAKTVAEKKAAAEALAGADAQHHEIIRDARSQAGQILVEARGQAEVMKHRLLEEAKLSAEKVMAEMKADIKRERAAMMADAKRELADIVTAAAGSLLENHAGQVFDAKAAEAALREVEKVS